jgi:hypothetical protein
VACRSASISGPALDNVVAIKVAPFNRYRTLDIIGGVVEAGAEERVALYTGNDDHILLDLVTPFMVTRAAKPVTLRFGGGLLGHWSVRVRSARGAARALPRCRPRGDRRRGAPRPRRPDQRLQQRFFRCRQRFPRLHRRLPRGAGPAGTAGGYLVPRSRRGLSPGQKAKIDCVYAAHGDLADDGFVAANLARWLG